MAAAHVKAAVMLLLGLAACAHTPLSVGAAASGKGSQSSKGSRWRRAPAPPPPPGAKLFAEAPGGVGALSWDSDDVARARQLHARAFGDKGAYLGAASLADYLGLGPVEEMHLPVPLNIVFLGFQGDGNARVRVDGATLAEWFGSVDQLLPHVRVSLAELDCGADGHCTGRADGVVEAAPLPARVRYSFSANVVAVGRSEVIEAYERALAAFGRQVDPEDEAEGAERQVDALKLEPFIDSFVDALGLGGGYTLIVANPKAAGAAPAYGFRAGFSAAEVEYLQSQIPQLHTLSLSHWDNEPAPPRLEPPQRGGLFARGAGKAQVADLQDLAAAWAKEAQAYLGREEDHQRTTLRALSPARRGGGRSIARGVSLLRRKDGLEMGRLLASMITLPTEHFHNPDWGASHPLEDCLTPLWVGRGRWALLDLTAQRTEWGPALGGEGVVVGSALPDVKELFSDAAEAHSAARDERAGEDPDHDRLKAELNARGTEREARVKQQQAHAAAMHAATAHVVRPAGATTHEEEREEMESRHQETLLHTQLDVYEEFALQHCHMRENPPAACSEAREAVAELRQELQGLAARSPNKLSVFREHNWDIFGLSDPEDTHQEVADAHSRALEHFLAQLSDAASRALRHVVAPPAAAWRRRHGPFGAPAPVPQEVHFSVFSVRDASRKQAAWRERGAAFDVGAFEREALRLALPRQAFTFSHTRLDLLDDPQLAAAFSLSLRSAFAQVPNAAPARRQFDPQYEVQYLDSRELGMHLRRRFPDVFRHTSEDQHAKRAVPVFVFDLDRDAPVLIDEHYNAKALEDMVLVVDNAAGQDEHPTGFMCEGTLVSRPLSPLRHALAATLQHLGGVLPPHLGYSPGRHLVTHDWLWSVGAHPLSWTSTGTAYTQMHLDALHRGYVVDALDETADLVNRGVALLADEKPSEGGYSRLVLQRAAARRALAAYAQCVDAWRAAVARAAALDFGGAAGLIDDMQRAAWAFLVECTKLDAELHPQRCADRTPMAPGLLRALVAGSAAAVALTLALTCGVPRKAKAG